MSGPTAGLTRVLDRYRALTDDLATVRAAGPADPGLSATVGSLLAAEARWLDARHWAAWLSWCADDCVVWVPLDPTHPDPAADQSLFLDDRRRLDERVWRLSDPHAWALLPAPSVTRAVAAAEAWPAPDSGDVLAASALTLHYVRSGQVWTTAGRQVHRLRAAETGWSLVGKTLLLPGLTAGTPHLGWLL